MTNRRKSKMAKQAAQEPQGMDLNPFHADVIQLFGDDEPAYHTLLEVWKKVLEPSTGLAKQPVTPQYASRMVSKYAGLTFPDVEVVHGRFYAKLEELKGILDSEIASDPDCLSYDNAEDDDAENGYHYKNLMLLWQAAIQQWELDWRCTDEQAAAELAAISEVHTMIFDPGTGLIAHLQSINFNFTEDDAAFLLEALGELREQYLNGVTGE